MPRKDFLKRNQGFICLQCGAENKPAERGERNHCFRCLYSLHVDEETPGDRKSACRGLMEPVGLDYKGKKGFMIRHECVKCGKEMLNMKAEDDDWRFGVSARGIGGLAAPAAANRLELSASPPSLTFSRKSEAWTKLARPARHPARDTHKSPDVF